MFRLANSRSGGRRLLQVTSASRSPFLNGLKTVSKHEDMAVLSQQQYRSMGIFSGLDFKKAQLKKTLDLDPNNETAMLNYMTSLTQSEPITVVRMIEKGWSTRAIPVNEAYLREYLKAVAKLGKLDSINITGLLALIARPHGQGASAGDAMHSGGAGLSAEEISNLIKNVTTASNSGGGGGFGGAGRTPAEPLYVVK